jgi:peptide-methionine (S)-S-oxide reductase
LHIPNIRHGSKSIFVFQIFWENHDPTLENRQGRSTGTQYRSGIYYYTDEQKFEAEASRDKYSRLLQSEGHGKIFTEIKPVSKFYYAEDYHQQYLHKNPEGYCGLKGTGVSCS